MTASNRFWLYSQAGMVGVVVLASVIGIITLQLGSADLENSIAVSVNSYFILPGLAISLIANQILLLTRKQPRIVRDFERILLGIEYGAIVLLAVGSPFAIFLPAAIALAICLIPLAIVLVVLIVSGNNPRQAPTEPDARVAPYAPPAPGDRIA